MSKTLVVQYTPRNGSVSKQIMDSFLEAAGDKTEVIVRDLSDGGVPLITTEAMATWWDANADNSFEKVSNELVDELMSADKVVIVTPMFNFALPAAVKAWFDAVIRGGKTFAMGEEGVKGLVPADDAALFFASGFTAPGAEIDDLSSNVKTNLGFIGVKNLSVIAAGGLQMISEEEAAKVIESAKEGAQSLVAEWYS